jgi:imidazolonepropionase-like amidohydrolase
MKHLIASLACAGALAAAALPAFAASTAIVGGTVYPVGAPRIDDGTVLITNGRIAAIGRNVAIPAGAVRIDARGKTVTPGLIDAATVLGLVEISGERATNHASARGTINADFQPWLGFNSDSAYIPATRSEGVTTVAVVPQGGTISGQVALVDLDRGTASDMMRRGPVAMAATVETGGRGGEDQDETAGAADELAGGTATFDTPQPPISRGEAFLRLHDIIADARFYAAHKDAVDRGASRQLIASGGALAALAPVVAGTMPLMIRVDKKDDIDALLRFAKRENVRVAIFGGAEAWKIASRIAAAHVPVITGAMNSNPESFDSLGQRQENAAILRRAGVVVALVGNAGGGDEEQFNVRNVKYEAGNAVAYGMTHDDALRAVTLAPAEIFGVADRVGSLAVGKDANVVVWSGDPFEFSTNVEHVFVRGHEISEESRQDMLTKRYRSLAAPIPHTQP